MTIITCPVFVDGIYGFSNSVPSKPFKKVDYGKDKFAQLISEHSTTKDKDLLQQQLFTFMNDKTM